jgi:hypothetical protein
MPEEDVWSSEGIKKPLALLEVASLFDAGILNPYSIFK